MLWSPAMEKKPEFNSRNPAVKRILQEIKEMKASTSTEFIAEALEDDIFEWHFVVRGPPDSEFEGGVYHGRILLPADYPFKPPSFMMLTPNGRFETGVKICLSISSHHPEHWQPSWSMRTALTALIAFMPTPGQGALGSLDFSKEERRALAAASPSHIPKYGSPSRQQVTDRMHQQMLDIIRNHPEQQACTRPPECEVQARGTQGASTVQPAEGSSPVQTGTERPSGSIKEDSEAPSSATAGAGPQTTAVVDDSLPAAHEGPSERGLTWLAVALSVAILALIVKKVIHALQYSTGSSLPLGD